LSSLAHLFQEQKFSKTFRGGKKNRDSFPWGSGGEDRSQAPEGRERGGGDALINKKQKEIIKKRGASS